MPEREKSFPVRLAALERRLLEMERTQSAHELRLLAQDGETAKIWAHLLKDLADTIAIRKLWRRRAVRTLGVLVSLSALGAFALALILALLRSG